MECRGEAPDEDIKTKRVQGDSPGWDPRGEAPDEEIKTNRIQGGSPDWDPRGEAPDGSHGKALNPQQV